MSDTRFKRLKRRLGFPLVTVIVTLAFAVLIGFSLMDGSERRTRGQRLSWAPSSPGPQPSAIRHEDLPALKAKLTAAQGAQVPAGARERASLLHEIGRLKTPDSRTFLLSVAEQRRYEIVERLAAVSALARVGDSAALDEIAATTSDALVQAKVIAMRAATPMPRGGDK